jgi:putative integral membrane protein (TIGR02587 family)
MRFSHHRSVLQSAREYGRGIAGGLLFSLPMLYTMEVWAAGFRLSPGRILVLASATFVLLLLYNRFAGLRRDASLAEVAIDSVEELGLGLVIAAVMLWLTGQIDSRTHFAEIAGKTVVEAMAVAIGVSVGTSQLGGEDGEEEEGMCGDDTNSCSDYLAQSALALCGTVLFAANIAPTDEMELIAMESPPWKILLLAFGSLFGAAGLLHFTGIHGADRHVARDSPFHTVRGVITTYAVALAGSAGCLFFFGKLDGQPVSMGIAMTVVVGVPAALGASAGRLLLQTQPQERR